MPCITSRPCETLRVQNWRYMVVCLDNVLQTVGFFVSLVADGRGKGLR